MLVCDRAIWTEINQACTGGLYWPELSANGPTWLEPAAANRSNLPDDRQNLIFIHDQHRLAVDLDLDAGVTGEYDSIAVADLMGHS